MIVRKAKKEDLISIFEIELESFSDPYSLNDLEYELFNNPVSTILVLEEDGVIFGYYDFWTTFDSSTICKIAIKKNKRKQGLAKLLLEKGELYLKKENVETITLEVRESNIDAINLYKRNGFIEVTIKKNYYGDGENAIYMMKGLI